MYADPKELERMDQRNPSEKLDYMGDIDAALRRAAAGKALAPVGGSGITSLSSSKETVRQFYMVAPQPGNGDLSAELVIGLDGGTHARRFASGMPVADVVRLLRALAEEIEEGAFTRMEKKQ